MGQQAKPQLIQLGGWLAELDELAGHKDEEEGLTTKKEVRKEENEEG